jgi:hypothetical protein
VNEYLNGGADLLQLQEVCVIWGYSWMRLPRPFIEVDKFFTGVVTPIDSDSSSSISIDKVFVLHQPAKS